MRTTKRTVLHLLISVGLVLGLAGQVQAATFEPSGSVLSLQLGGLPQTEFLALPGTESLVTSGNQPELAGHRIWASSTVWSTINFGPGTSLFTGVPSISNLKITLVNEDIHLSDGFTSNPTGSPPTHFGGAASVGPTFGGIATVNGTVILEILGGLKQGIPLDVVGQPLGSAITTTVGPLSIFASGHPWQTSSVQVSQVTSNLITLPDRAPCAPTCVTPTTGTRVQGVAFTLNVDVAGGETQMTLSTGGSFVSVLGGDPLENHTVTVTGSNALISGSQAGTLTVVAPLWIDAGAALGNLPGALTMSFEFVPEPGTLLLLASGAIGLAVIGRRRMRK
jgi:hypothetical protein